MQVLQNLHTTRGSQPSAHPAAELLRPVVEIEVFGKHGHFGTGQPFDPAKNLISVSTAKALSQPTGSAQIQLTGGVWGGPATMSWLDLLNPMDMVIVRMGRSGPQSVKTVFCGYIMDLQEQADVSTPNQPRRSIAINAQDLNFGFTWPQLTVPPQSVSLPLSESKQPIVKEWAKLFKVFLDNSVPITFGGQGGSQASWLAQYLSAVTGGSTHSFMSLTPSQFIEALVVYVMPVLFGPITDLALSGAAGSYSFNDFINLYLCDTTAFSYATFSPGPSDSSLWSMFLSFSNPPFFELFGDLRGADQLSDLIPPPGQPGFGSSGQTGIETQVVGSAGAFAPPSLGPDGAQFYLVLRPTPYDPLDWARLITQTVPSEDVLGYTLGKAQASTKNLYLVYPESMMQTLSSVSARAFPGLADADSILNYGMAPAFYPLYGLANPTNTASEQFVVDQTSVWNQRLYNWYWKNPEWLAGQVQVTGDGRYRVGQKFSAPWWPLEAYIEGVSHTFVVFGEYRTTLTISRGAHPGERFPSSLATTTPIGIPHASKESVSGLGG